jgi:septal ring factor EnvC (AmiA/AmiB activator)
MPASAASPSSRANSPDCARGSNTSWTFVLVQLRIAQKDSSLTQKSEIETQLKQIRLDRANTQRKNYQNRDRVQELENQIKDTDVKILNVEREYRQSLNMIDDFKIKIQEFKLKKPNLINRKKNH